MGKYINKILKILITAGFIFFYPHLRVIAAIKTPLQRLKDFGDRSGFNTGQTNPEKAFTDLIAIIISALLSVLGLVFLILIIYSGFTWMTAGGDENKVTKAKETLKNAIIGLVLTAGSYAIWGFIVEPLL